MSADFMTFLAIGFFAQLVDGALGMAFGVISTTTLLTVGLSPAHASAMVHTAEVFTTAASAVSHAIHKNINRRLVVELAVAGSVGAIIGAYVLSNIDGRVMRPFVAAYLLVLGLSILLRAFHAPPETDAPPAFAAPLGIVGGFLDAIGGGGWGATVTSTLLGSGHAPRMVRHLISGHSRVGTDFLRRVVKRAARVIVRYGELAGGVECRKRCLGFNCELIE